MPITFNLSSSCATGGPNPNNLGGFGPVPATDAEMRFVGVVWHAGAAIDLVVTVDPSAHDAYSPGAPSGGFYHGCSYDASQDPASFGTISQAVGSTVRYDFSLQDSASRAPVALPSFYFSFFDIENAGSEERLALLGLGLG